MNESFDPLIVLIHHPGGIPMKNTTRVKLLRIITLVAATGGYLLRAYLYASAVDQKGLIVAGHWATWVLCGLTVAFLASLIVIARNPEEELDYWDCFTPSVWRFCGALLASAAILYRVLWDAEPAVDYLSKLSILFGVGAGIGLIFIAFRRFAGTKPSFLCPSAVSVFFSIQMVNLYRAWSSDPQLLDYGFYLGAFVCLMFTAYFQAHFQVDPRNHRALWIAAMAATYFCCVAIPESQDTLFLVICAFWAFTCTPQIEAKPRRQRPEMMMYEGF